uniref:Uncharacterized protein n=1 Tax=Periparus ater parvoviridae sp. TaxID=2794527 RepID=A0A8A4XDE4_9VIRU|nr:MAG: hypothetical protein [Periparus ater parvoviridae sp.]
MAKNISYEPSTLVYTLLDTSEISFNDFSLIVRSLHSYMVDSILPNPESNNVHVKLNYQASLANATAKLGSLQNIISVTKLSSFVKDTELTTLEQLRRRYNFGGDAPAAPSYLPGRNRQRAIPRGNGRRIFTPRPAPYPKPTTTTPAPANYEEEDGEQAFTAADLPCEFTQQI